MSQTPEELSSLATAQSSAPVNTPRQKRGFQFDLSIENSIARAASKYGVPLDVMRIIAQIESRGNPNAKNPNSSASGLYQFINGTARQMGLDESSVFDPDANADAGARFIKQNIEGLRRTLGRDPTTSEIYLAHQQGLGGARAILGNPDALAIETVGPAAIRLNGVNSSMTNRDYASLWNNKVGGLPGGPSSATAPPTQSEFGLLANGVGLAPETNVAESIEALRAQAEKAKWARTTEAMTFGPRMSAMAWSDLI